MGGRVFAPPDHPDGNATASRQKPGTPCFGPVERDDVGVTLASDSVRLVDMPAEIAALLGRYRKGLDRWH